MIKKGKQSVTKQLERCLSQRFFETNQCLIFHGFAVTKTEAKEFQTEKVKVSEVLKLEENCQGNRKEIRRKKNYECLVWKDCFSIHSWIWLLSIT